MNPQAQIDQAAAAARAAGVTDHALASVALRVDRALLADALRDAAEIAAVCALVDRRVLADQYIRAGLSSEGARHALLDLLADEDEATVVDTTPRATNRTAWQRSEG